MCNSKGIVLNNEMKRLIRSIVEVIIEEGYDVSVIAEEIYSTHKDAVKDNNINELDDVNFNEDVIHNVEKKLWNRLLP